MQEALELRKARRAEVAAQRKFEANRPKAECPRCHKRYYVLPGNPLLDDGERYDHVRRLYILRSHLECCNYDCTSSHSCLGWCIIVDSFDDDDESYTQIKKAELKNYYSEIKQGEQVQKYLQEIR